MCSENQIIYYTDIFYRCFLCIRYNTIVIGITKPGFTGKQVMGDIRNKKQDVAEKTFRVPGGLIIPLIGITAIVWLLTSLSKWEILSTIIFIGIVCIIYFVMAKIKNSRILEDIKEELI